MAVQFSFGRGETFVLPDDSDTIEKKFAQFLAEDEDKQSFRSFFRRALENAKAKGTYESLRKEFSTVLKKVLQDNVLSEQIYKADGEAYAEFVRGDNQQENIQFAKETSLYDVLTDNDKYSEMVGTSYFKYGRDLEKLPPMDIEDFLETENLEEYYMESSHDIGVVVTLGDYTKQMQELLVAYKGKENTLMDIDAFTDDLNIKYSNAKESDTKYDFEAEIPEQHLGVSSTADKFQEYYVNYIRDNLGVRSGGFIPAGQYYTTGVESKVEYRPLGKVSFTIDILTEEIKDKLELGNFMNLVNQNITLPENLMLEFDVTKEAEKQIIDSKFFQDKIAGLTTIRELKMFEIRFTVSVSSPSKPKWKKGSDNERQELLYQPFKEANVNAEIRIADIGKFDFSYYSKAGDIKKDKMNDHLNEIRTKVRYLSKFGVEGGI